METPLCLSPRELFLSPQGEQNFSINPWRGTHLDIHKWWVNLYMNMNHLNLAYWHSSVKNLLVSLPCSRRLGGGGSRRLIISARWARLQYCLNPGSWPVSKWLPSKMSQIYKSVNKSCRSMADPVVFLTMHPTFHTSTLYVHGTPRITSGAR